MGAQLEDGYTRIANELLEHVPRFKFNGTQLRIVLIVWRYTFGFMRKDHGLSIGFISKATGLSYKSVEKEMKNLIETKVLFVSEESTKTKSRKIGMNKYYSEWEIECNLPPNDGSPTIEGDLQNAESVPCEQGGGSPTIVGEMSPQSVGEVSPLIIGEGPLRLGGKERKYIKKDLKDNIYTIFEYWNSKKIIVHREMPDAMKRAINARLKSNSETELIEAIENYHFCLKSKEHYYSHKFTLKEFMNPKNVDKFLTINDPRENFRDKYKKPHSEKAKKRLSPEEIQALEKGG
ncbi:replication protein [Paenibacillus apiarius]|uniref:replication protein n=1 Tax=Paenibacillus apiarius TaxID=46240 RepID=UPI003B3A2953